MGDYLKKLWLFAVLLLWPFAGAFAQFNLQVARLSVHYDSANPDCQGMSAATAVALLDRSTNTYDNPPSIEFDKPRTSYPGGCLILCAKFKCVNSYAAAVAADYAKFEIFKFASGSNINDAASTPAVASVYVQDPITCSAKATTTNQVCMAWDGSYNLDGEFGKTNGNFGFRGIVHAQYISEQTGTVEVTSTMGFPGQVTDATELVSEIDSFNGGNWNAGSNWTLQTSSAVASNASSSLTHATEAQTSTTYTLKYTVFNYSGGTITPYCGTTPSTGRTANGTYTDTITCSAAGATLYLTGTSFSGAVKSVSLTGGSEGFYTQRPLTVDVTNLHAVRSSPTVVGRITGVAAQPYNVLYRLSKDSLVSMNVYRTSDLVNPIRTVISSASRTGEGTPSGSLTNGDSWDGRDAYGALVSSGDYIVRLDAVSTDEYGTDIAYSVTRQITLDPLQITDIVVKPLTSLTTDLAALSYMLTESATVVVKIYPADTTFSNISMRPDLITATASPLRTLTEHKASRATTTSIWDGRTDDGVPLADGDYVYMLYALTPSSSTSSIYSSAHVGMIPVSRGLVGLNIAPPASTVVGSSPTAAALDPYTFKYTVSRDANASVRILTSSGAVVRTIINHEAAASNFTNVVNWNGLDDNGYYVSSGTYIVEYTAADSLVPSMVTRNTSLFPVDMFRVVDVADTPLLSGASTYATISYMLSQSMNTELRIYPPGTVIPTSGVWPPTVAATPVKTFSGVRPGRYRIAESWDGMNGDTMLADGEYPYMILAYSSSSLANYSVSGSTTVITPIYTTDRITGNVTVSRGPVYLSNVSITPTIPKMNTSSETVKIPPYEIDFQVSRISSVTIQAISSSHCGAAPYVNNICRTIAGGQLYESDVINKVYWDGTDDFGAYVPRDAYTIRIQAYNYPNPALQTATTYQTSLDVIPFKLYDLAIGDLNATSGVASVNYQLSVPMKVGVQIFKPNTRIDTNGNPVPAISAGSLVKSIVGIKSQLTQIQDLWDGTDRTGAQVADGVYVFRIVSSTDSTQVDTVTGEQLCTNKTCIADIEAFMTPQTITVSRGSSGDVCADWNSTTSFYPNPLRVSQGTFRATRFPVTANYTLKIYNLAGDLVYSDDWGTQAPSSTYPNYEKTWAKVNSAGRSVARGIYFAVLELKATTGGQQVCQTIKKILIP